MKHPLHLALLLIVNVILAFTLPGCATGGGLTPGGISTSVQIAALALDSYGKYAEATSGGQKISHAQIAAIVSADLSGIAAIAQASIGKTPDQAGIVSGAANVMPAAPVVAALPNAPISQATVQTLHAAAAQASQKSQP